MKKSIVSPHRGRLAGWILAGFLAWPGLASERGAWLGVRVLPVQDALRHQLELPRGAGLTVDQVGEGSPAARAGVRRHDVLLRLNDQWLFHPDQLAALVRSHAPGEKVELGLLRLGGHLELAVELGEPPAALPGAARFAGPVPWALEAGEPARRLREMERQRFEELERNQQRLQELLESEKRRSSESEQQERQRLREQHEQEQLRLREMHERERERMRDMIERQRPRQPIVLDPFSSRRPRGFLGVEVRPADPALQIQLGRSDDPPGVLVGHVVPDSPAAAAGLQEHDLLLHLGDQPIKGPEHFIDLIRQGEPGQKIALNLLRGGQPLHLEIELAPTRSPTREPLGVRLHTRLQSLAEPGRVLLHLLQDDLGEIEVRREGDRKWAVIRGPAGRVLFEGELDPDAWAQKVPAGLRERLQKLLDRLELLPPPEPPAPPPVVPPIPPLSPDTDPEQPGSLREWRLLSPPVPPGFIRAPNVPMPPDPPLRS